MLVAFAKFYATFAHWACGHRRKYSGVPYINHPAEVYHIVKRVTKCKHTLAACWLHDVVEDAGFWGQLMRFLFPKRTVSLVLQVTDVSRPADGNREARVAKDRRHLANAEREAQNVKLGDLISNTRDIAEADPAFAKVYIAEKALLLPYLMRGDSALWKRAANQVMRAAKRLDVDYRGWHPRMIDLLDN